MLANIPAASISILDFISDFIEPTGPIMAYRWSKEDEGKAEKVGEMERPCKKAIEALKKTVQKTTTNLLKEMKAFRKPKQNSR